MAHLKLIIGLALLQLTVQIQSGAAAAKRVAAPTIFDDLLRHLFRGYNPRAMPRCSPEERLHIRQDMLLYQLFELDEPSQTLSVDVWLESDWRDCRLVWRPEAFNNVSEFAVKSSSLWYPDLVLYESLHGNVEEGTFVYADATAVVRSDGWVRLGAQALLRSFCRVNVARFPYDGQVCNLTFASWSADPTSLTLRLKPSIAPEEHTFRLSGNGEWEVAGFPSFERSAVRRPGARGTVEADQAVSEVVFQLKLKRKPLFYKIYLLFPCMLITWLAAVVFAVPAQCGERVAYVMTLMLSLVVFLLLVANNVPRSGNTLPLISVYFLQCVCLISVAACMVIASYNVSMRRDEFIVPAWLRCCFRLGPFIGFGADRFGRRRSTPTVEGSAAEEEEALASDGEWRQLGDILDRLFSIVYILINSIVTGWILLVGA